MRAGQGAPPPSRQSLRRSCPMWAVHVSTRSTRRPMSTPVAPSARPRRCIALACLCSATTPFPNHTWTMSRRSGRDKGCSSTQPKGHSNGARGRTDWASRRPSKTGGREQAVGKQQLDTRFALSTAVLRLYPAGDTGSASFVSSALQVVAGLSHRTAFQAAALGNRCGSAAAGGPKQGTTTATACPSALWPPF
jgi:hypothetical protein